MKRRVIPVIASATILLSLSFCGKEAPPAAAAPTPAVPAAAAPPPSVAQNASSTTPEMVVQSLYDDQAHEKGPFFQADSRAVVDRFFEPGLADLIWKDAVESKGEVGALDFDPLFDAQDSEITKFAISPAEMMGSDGSRVRVSFDNFGKPQTIVYSLARSGAAWKISDIAWGDGRTLRATMTPAAASVQ